MAEVNGDGEVLVKVREKPVATEGGYALKMAERGLTEDGSMQIPDPVPMEPPLGFVKQPSMVDYVRGLVRSEQLRLTAQLAGYESFEEAEDFSVEDELEPGSAYEMEEDFEPVAVLRDKLKKAETAAAAAAAEAASRRPAAAPSPEPVLSPPAPAAAV